MKQPEIRKAAVKDGITVSKIITESFKRRTELLQVSETEYPNHVAFETERMAITRINNSTVKILFVNDEPIGTIGTRQEGEIGIIDRLAILPSYRGENYGRLLLEHSENELFNNDCTEIHISLVASYQNLRRFYVEHGYTCISSTTLSGLPCEVLSLRKYKR
ncbi:hypothetical protein H70357_17580 [Paenibacillus sp. FSL H7-0357]|uniref:GNAT family N-acetyltransferase n=1 Tax=Paenibacillus sp. FSL H7-0357 TaxID=1536774 RepID=UPI0004F748FE|nr:GNAT family N-acetyltransferase [Paenibacillus sp. FSL H7-0357]AIQ18301.1 hypothetical protein H70357_17580 [Paenibacillus sp. FSL H7-0357]